MTDLIRKKIIFPFFSYSWATNQLIEEALNLILRSEIQYGFENSQKERINLESTMIKSQQQIESVRKSPEFQRCQQMEQEGRKLTNVCEFSRHQAASIDEIKAEIQFPQYITRSGLFYKAADIVKFVFLGQMWEEESSHTSQTTLKLLAKVKRTGEEAQIVAEIAGRKYKIENVRIPMPIRHIFPMSMRNNMAYTLMQKYTRNQIPASCRVEPQYVATFDNKTYNYQLNDCWHLLFKDCSNRLPVAIMAKGQQEKVVKVLAGQVELVMQRQSSEVMIQMNLEGRTEQIQVHHNQVKEITNSQGRVVMEVMRYVDNVYHIFLRNENTLVLFNGERVEISAPQMLKSRACGLCGDLDHENTADLQTPNMCIMSKPRYSAYSYMIEESCQGIPSQDKPRYEQERQQCAKTRIIPTPTNTISKILPHKTLSQVSMVTKTMKPMTRQHIVKYENGKTCFSVQRMAVCSKISKNEVQEPKPVKVQRKLVQYVCVQSPSIEAQALEQRARAGESLEMLASGKSVAFSKVEYEPVECQRQSNHL